MKEEEAEAENAEGPGIVVDRCLKIDSPNLEIEDPGPGIRDLNPENADVPGLGIEAVLETEEKGIIIHIFRIAIHIIDAIFIQDKATKPRQKKPKQRSQNP